MLGIWRFIYVSPKHKNSLIVEFWIF
jgi:hypothetical protein